MAKTEQNTGLNIQTADKVTKYSCNQSKTGRKRIKTERAKQDKTHEERTFKINKERTHKPRSMTIPWHDL